MSAPNRKIFACFSKNEDVDFVENPLDAAMSAALSLVKVQKFVDLFFVDTETVTYFMTRPGRQFQLFTAELASRGEKKQKWCAKCQPYAYLELHVSEEDEDRLFRTCETFAGLRVPYNLRDGMMYGTFQSNPAEIDLFGVRKLADVQAAILLLRQCLLPTHPIVDAVKGLNSRTCTADTLFDALVPVAAQSVHAEDAASLFWKR